MGKNNISLRSFALVVIASILLLSFAAATYNVFLSSGGTSKNVLERTSSFYNVSLNISTAALGNVTQVNITVPSSFTVDSNTNGTSITNGNYVLTISGGVLSFTNATVLANATFPAKNSSFWFNASAATVGGFNVSVVIRNDTGLTFSNISVLVNETTTPAFASPSIDDGANSSSASVTVNVSATDVVSLNSFRFFLINSSGGLANVSTVFRFGTSNSSTLTFLSLSDGLYNITANANDTAGNVASNISRIFRVDTTAPSLSLAESEDTTDERVIVDITTSDSGSGLSNSGLCTSSNDGTIVQTSGGQSYIEENLECDTDYTISITCTDFTSNAATEEIVVTTDRCSSGSGGGGSSSSGSSGSSTTTTWTNTIIDTQIDLSEKGSVSKQLSAKQRVTLKVGGVSHNVGVTSLTTTSATIQVESTPQTATMNVGETKKFDVNADGFYDISVKLNSITNGKADVTITYIHEAVPATETPSSTDTSTSGSPTTSTSAEASGSSMAWVWILVAVIVIAIVVVLIVKARKR